MSTLNDGLSTQDAFLERYQQVRVFTEELCKPLEIEDYVIQSMPDVNPTKWHIGHTSWFFETFILSKPIPIICHCIHSTHTYLTPTTCLLGNVTVNLSRVFCLDPP